VVPELGTQNISFNFSDPDPDGFDHDYSFTDAGISDQQFNVVQRFIGRLTSFMRPNDILMTSILTQTMNFPPLNDQNLIPVEPGGGAGMSYNPTTNRRTDKYIDGGPVRHASGEGNTVLQNYQAQTSIMSGMLRARFGRVNATGRVNWGAPDGKRYVFSGSIRRPVWAMHRICF
jgi:hypothetical protein